MDAGNLLKPMLARGELHCIGATTLDEYRQYIEKDPALERRFQTVLVQEPTVEDTIAILRGLKERYEVFHGVKIHRPGHCGRSDPVQPLYHRPVPPGQGHRPDRRGLRHDPHRDGLHAHRTGSVIRRKIIQHGDRGSRPEKRGATSCPKDRLKEHAERSWRKMRDQFNAMQGQVGKRKDGHWQGAEAPGRDRKAESPRSRRLSRIMTWSTPPS